MPLAQSIALPPPRATMRSIGAAARAGATPAATGAGVGVAAAAEKEQQAAAESAREAEPQRSQPTCHSPQTQRT